MGGWMKEKEEVGGWVEEDVPSRPFMASACLSKPAATPMGLGKTTSPQSLTRREWGGTSWREGGVGGVGGWKEEGRSVQGGKWMGMWKEGERGRKVCVRR